MSHIHGKLEEYVVARGIDMPVYRSGSKIREESDELIDALTDYLKKPSAKRRQHLMEEVADVAIVNAVAAMMGGFSVEEALDYKIEKDRGRGSRKNKK